MSYMQTRPFVVRRVVFVVADDKRNAKVITIMMDFISILL